MGNLSAMGVHGDAAARRLEDAMAKLIGTVEGLDEATLHRMPGEGEWSATQTLAHVAEMVPFWARRAQQVARGELPGPRYDRTDAELAQRNAAIDEHGHDRLPAVVQLLRTSTRQAAETLRSIPDEDWQRSALWESETVRHTVHDLVEQRLHHHVEAHIQQAAAAARRSRAG